MKKIIENIIGYKNLFISFIMVRYFLLCSNKYQHYLIMKNTSMFLGMQNLAKKYDDDGDTRSAMLISSESYDYLCKLCLYCDAKKIDPNTAITWYAP